MQNVGRVYFTVILALVVTQLFGWAAGRAMPLLELLLSPQTLAAMVAGLSGRKFWEAIEAHIRLRGSTGGAEG